MLTVLNNFKGFYTLTGHYTSFLVTLKSSAPTTTTTTTTTTITNNNKGTEVRKLMNNTYKSNSSTVSRGNRI